MQFDNKITSVDMCIDVFNLVINKKTALNSDERYALHLAKKFFIANLDHFNQYQQIMAFSCPGGIKLNLEDSNDFLDRCINNQTHLPYILPAWTDHNNFFKIQNKLVQYIDILVQKNETVQLEYLYKKMPEFFINYYSNSNYQSENLTDLVLKKHPFAIFYNRAWSSSKINNWLEDNSNQLIGITCNFFNYQSEKVNFTNSMPPESSSKFFEILVKEITLQWSDYILSRNTINSNVKDKWQDTFNIGFLDFLVKSPIELLISLEQSSPQLFNHLLSLTDKKEVNLSEDSSFNCSLLQIIYSKKTSNSLTDAEDMFDFYNFEILKPVKENFCFYNKEIDFLEYALRSSNFYLFEPMKNHITHMKDEHQKLFIAGQFSILNNSFTFLNTHTQSVNIKTVIQSLNLCQQELIIEALDSFKEFLHIDTFNIINSLSLNNKLNNTLPTIQNKSKARKI